MHDLKEKAIRGGAVRVANQGVNFILRLGSMALMARLLGPNEFGLVAMVTVVTGVYDVFTSAGLSSATIQHDSITPQQVTNLFWVNMLVGTILCLLSVATAPALVTFYHEPRLFWITMALASGFLFNAAGVQHSALLQRQMKFPVLAVIETISLAVSTAVGISMALAGLGYWALVAMATVNPAVSSSLKWAVAGWVPGRPRRDADIRSLLRFGGTVTLNSLVIYLGYNLEKVLLGRFGGPDVLGLYSRAYYLAAIPTDNINSTAGAVGFAALSRLQSDPERLKRFFLKGYSIVISVTLPTTIFCALFADDLILVLLGAKWGRAVDIFRLLTPTVLIFGMLNPWGWLLPAIGLQERSLKIALVIAPTVICAYLAGLPYGAKGVAVAYSAALSLLVVPLIMWCVRGTIFTSWDVWSAIRVPLLATLAGGSFAFAVRSCLDPYLSHLLMLMVGGAAMALSYLGMLLFVLGQKEMYLGLIRELKRKTPGEVAAGVEN